MKKANNPSEENIEKLLLSLEGEEMKHNQTGSPILGFEHVCEEVYILKNIFEKRHEEETSKLL